MWAASSQNIDADIIHNAVLNSIKHKIKHKICPSGIMLSEDKV
jgi:hypothetical protein